MQKSTANKQTKKNRQERLYTVFLVVLAAVVLVLCIFFLLRTCESIPVASVKEVYPTSEVSAFRVENASHDFSFRWDGTLWHSDADDTFPVDAEKTAQLLETAASLPDVEILSSHADPAAYGLSASAARLTVTLQGGTEKVFLIGSTDSADGRTAFLLNDSARIMTTGADLARFSTLSEYDLITVPQAPTIDAKSVTEIRIVNHALSTQVALRYFPQKRSEIDLSDTCTWFSAFPDGFERNGGQEEYCCVPADCLVPIREDIPLDEACIIPDAVACMYHAIKDVGKVKAGDRVLIYGAGSLGIQGVQIAKSFGAEITVAGRTQAKLDASKEAGADHLIHTSEENLEEASARITNELGFDVIFDMVGIQSTIDRLLHLTRPAGKLVLVGYAAEQFSVNTQETVVKEKEILGIRGSTRQNLRDCVRLVEQGVLKPHIYKKYRLEEINSALAELEHLTNVGRVTITFP